MSTAENTSVALIVQGPTGLSVDRQAVAAMYAGIETQIAEFKYDLTTETGRARAASLAYGIAKRRTAVEADKKRLKEGLLAQGRAIDGAWNEIKEKLETLQATARRPLTEWEAAEEQRIARVARVIEGLQLAPRLLATDTAERAAAILSAVEDEAIISDVFQERFETASALKNAAIISLRISVDALNQKEADAIELERLRTVQAARDKSDREAAETAELERLRKAAEEREQLQQKEMAETARLAEEKRVKLEAEKIAQAAKDAEEKTRRESEVKAKAEADRIAAEHEAELLLARRLQREAQDRERDAANRAAEEEAERNAEAVRIKAEAEKKSSEERKLAANKKHRQVVMTAAKVALMEHAGLDEDQARKAVLAISTEKIPSVSMRFA